MSFLSEPEVTPSVRRLFDEDVAEFGYVMNTSKAWAYQPETVGTLFDLMRSATEGAGLDQRRRGILVAACASALGDSYCSLAWGSRLAGTAGDGLAAAVLRGDDDGLTDGERVLAAWARKLARDPNGTTAEDVRALRGTGLSDAQIFAVTVFVALRIAFSTVNDAIGVRPDAALRTTVPETVRDAVSFGRPIAEG